MTELVLRDFTFEGEGLNLFYCNSAQEAKLLMLQSSEIALVLVDIVMETDRAGLDLVQWIREELGNEKVRIVLRTGQPGQAPGPFIIENYDIHDYKYKTELTHSKLKTLLYSTLRAYRDITSLMSEREYSEGLLRAKQAELQQILDNMVDAVITIDEAGHILSYNQSAEKLFGYTASDVLGKNVNCLMPNRYAREHDTYLQNYQKTGQARIIGIGREVQGMKKDGSLFPMRLSVAELPRGASEVRRYLGSCHDLSREKLQEEQLRLSQKMDVLGRLSGGIAHDFNNILGIMLGYTEMLSLLLKEQPTLQHYVGEISQAGERAKQLTGKLLAFSSARKQDATILDINRVLLGEKVIFEKALSGKIKLVYELSEQAWHSNLDEGDLANALLNLMINARDAIEGCGRVVLRTENVTVSEQQAWADNLKAGQYIRLSVIDNGSGMPEAIRTRIFEPFFTTKGAQGTGLGLLQVLGFVQRSNGVIRVESTAGEGSCFTLYFPRQTLARENVSVDNNATEFSKGGCETILVVEDEPQLRDLAAELLRSQGYTVVTAVDASAALEMLERVKADVLLTDVIMPGMDGAQLVQLVQQRYPEMKIQLMSGFSDESQLQHLNPAISQHCLYKPYRASTLFAAIRRVLEEG